MNPEDIMPFVALVVSNSVVIATLLINGWFSRRQRRADAHKTQADAHKTREEAEALDATTQGDRERTLQASVKWWEDMYGGLVQRSDALKLELDAMSAHFDEFRASANLALENLREQLGGEKKQRQYQSKIIIEMQTQLENRATAIIELQRKVGEMQAVIDAQALTIDKLRADLVRSGEELCEERALRKQLEKRMERFNGEKEHI